MVHLFFWLKNKVGLFTGMGTTVALVVAVEACVPFLERRGGPGVDRLPHLREEPDTPGGEEKRREARVWPGDGSPLQHSLNFCAIASCFTPLQTLTHTSHFHDMPKLFTNSTLNNNFF